MDESSSTKQRLLAAAIGLLGAQGAQAVTHRNVEEEAGVARGSTRYHFGTREQLLAAVLEHMAHQGTGVIEQAADVVAGGSMRPGAMDGQTQRSALEAMAAAFLADPRDELARFELFLHVARRPELQDDLAHWRESFIDFAAQHLAARGASEPEAAARFCVAAMDGLILHAATTPHVDYLRLAPSWLASVAEMSVAFTGDERGR